MRKLELSESRTIMLDMCQAVHDFCIKEKINYSLAYGTLIGAYRHKGFIPWDDDFDIMMTRDEYERFSASFTHPRYKCMTPFNSPNHYYAFSRIVDTKTCRLSSKNIFGKRYTVPGVCIDLYIVDNVPEDVNGQKRMIAKVRRYAKFRKYTRKLMQVLHKVGLLNKQGAFYPMTMLCRLQAKLRSSVKSSTKVICFSGPSANSIIFEKNVFKFYSECQFEGHIFLTIKEYDLFLKRNYGDWLTPPPKEERIPYHGGEYYVY